MTAAAGRAWPAALGLALLAALWLSPLPAMSRTAFSPHMILHLGVAVVAAPLVAWGLARTRLGEALARPSLALALAASALEMLVVWGWHAPSLHELAALDGRFFALQQASFFLAGFVIWFVSLSGRSRAAAGIGAVALFATFTHMAMLGVLISLAPRLLYDPAVCQGAFGAGPLDDQRLGGALMAVGGGLPYLVGAAALLYRLLEEPRSAPSV